MVSANLATHSARLVSRKQTIVSFVLKEERMIHQNAHAQTTVLNKAVIVYHVIQNVYNVLEVQTIVPIVFLLENHNHLYVHAKMVNLKTEKENVKIVIQNA
jgi:hypothetical protein